ncbi:hypothetical protein P5V15_010802 [Pogonomyrmex californicus]
MPRNVEIKAAIRDVQRTISKATELSDTVQTKIEQYDIFFNIKDGRFKLRKFKDGTAELILYERSDTSGPKLSFYERIPLSSDITEPIANLFSRIMGMRGVVKKTRLLYNVGQTRVHIDEVDGLGNFIELEVVLQDDEDVKTGQKIANDLMQALFIKEEDLIAKAYIDLLHPET